MIRTRSNVGVVEQCPELVGQLRVLDDVVEDVVGDVFLGLVRAGGQRRRTAGAEVVLGLERCLTPRTLLEVGSLGLGFCIEIVVAEDLLVELLVPDAGVGLQHIRVDSPTGAVFNRLLGEPLTDPAADRGLPEVVCVHTASVDTGFVGEVLDPATEVLVPEGAVITAVVVPSVLVDQGSTLDVPSRVDVEVGREVSLTPGERHRSAGTLDVRVGVDGQHRRLSREVDVADAQRSDGADTEASVRQQGDETLVAGRFSGVEEGVDLLVLEEFVGVDRLGLRRTDGDVLGPVLATLVEEQLQGLAVVPHRTLGESVLVAQIEEELVDVGFGHLDERDVRALGREAEPVDVVDHSATVDVALTGVDVLLDCRPVGADVGRVQLLELVLELAAVPLNVVRVHNWSVAGVDYETSVCSPGWTTRNSYIILLANERQPSPYSPPEPQGVSA